VALITGGAGFIGSHLAKRLIADGYTVYIFDDLSTGYLTNIPAGAVFFNVDISHPQSIAQAKLPEVVDVVYHLAAQSSGEVSFDDPQRDILVNYLGTQNILDYAARKKAKAFIFTSSMSVYGSKDKTQAVVNEMALPSPKSYYGCNKLAAENAIRVFGETTGLPTYIFRLFNVYGPGQNMANIRQGMVSIYLSYINAKQKILVKGSMERFRDFIYIDDVIAALCLPLSNNIKMDEIYNVGTGVGTSVRSLLENILRFYGYSNCEEWILTEPQTLGDVNGVIADNKKLVESGFWQPNTDLYRGISIMIAWLKGQSYKG
jgi:UDP-glucose 4-epimerase